MYLVHSLLFFHSPANDQIRSGNTRQQAVLWRQKVHHKTKIYVSAEFKSLTVSHALSEVMCTSDLNINLYSISLAKTSGRDWSHDEAEDLTYTVWQSSVNPSQPMQVLYSSLAGKGLWLIDLIWILQKSKKLWLIFSKFHKTCTKMSPTASHSWQRLKRYHKVNSHDKVWSSLEDSNSSLCPTKDPAMGLCAGLDPYIPSQSYLFFVKKGILTKVTNV